MSLTVINHRRIEINIIVETTAATIKVELSGVGEGDGVGDGEGVGAGEGDGDGKHFQ